MSDNERGKHQKATDDDSTADVEAHKHPERDANDEGTDDEGGDDVDAHMLAR
jgi:hypothetical protein